MDYSSLNEIGNYEFIEIHIINALINYNFVEAWDIYIISK